MRKGTSFLELIFSIIVISIALLSIPIILNTISQTSSLINSQQEIHKTSKSLNNKIYDWNNINPIYATTNEKWGSSPLYFNNIFQKNTTTPTNIKLLNISTPNISMSAFSTKPTDINLTQVLLP